jgi:V/A-type H+-transporting ATPase subunit I
VVLVCPRTELGFALAKLCGSGNFHPSDRNGLVQDMELVLLSSRAHATYSESNALLRGSQPSTQQPAATFEADSITALVPLLSERLALLSESLKSPDLDPEQAESYQGELRSVRDAALTVFKDLARVRVRPGSRRFLVIEGFVPTSDLPAFSSALKPYFLHSVPIPRRQPGVPYVPSLVVNPRIVSLFEGVTLSQGVPKYNEVDPTPIVAFVFPFFFGLMFSDLGRGLILFGAGLLLIRRHDDRYAYLGRLLVVLGASASLAGALRGLFFGISLPYSAPLPSPSFLVQGASFDTAVFWLEVSIVIGTLHLAGGYVLATVNRFLSRDYAEAFLGYAPTLAFYLAAVPFTLAFVAGGLSLGATLKSTAPIPFFAEVAGVRLPASMVAAATLPVVALSLFLLLFGRATAALYSTRRVRPAVSALTRSTVETLVRPAELFIHTVSYIRLGILLIVGSVLGELLGGLFSQGAGGTVLGLLGNLAVTGIEALVVYIQDLRLNVYEWFSEFYSGAGKPFSPLISSGRTFTVFWSLP